MNEVVVVVVVVIVVTVVVASSVVCQMGLVSYDRRRKPNKDDFRDELCAINIGTWFLCVTDICKSETNNKLHTAGNYYK